MSMPATAIGHNNPPDDLRADLLERHAALLAESAELIALAENENAAQRVQTATGRSRCGRDCERESEGKRWRKCACNRCGAAVFCFNISRKKFACMSNLNEFGRKKGRSRSLQ